MYKRIVIILSVMIFSRSVFVFADTERREINDLKAEYKSADMEIDTHSAETNTKMLEFDDENINLIELMTDDETSKGNTGMLDAVSDNETVKEKIVSNDKILKKDEEILDTVSDNRFLEKNDTQGMLSVSDNEILEKDDMQGVLSVSDNEILKKDDTQGTFSISNNETLEKDIHISDSISHNEFMEEDDEEVTDVVSSNEIAGGEDQKETGEKAEKLDGSISDGDTDSQQEEPAIMKVSVPNSVHGWLDPENISGKGGIYSDEHEIINYGNRDIVVKIKKIKAFYKENKELYEFSEDVVGDEGTDIKKININMIWKNESENIEKVLNVIDGQVDEYVLYLKASEYDENNKFVKLNEGSVGTFCIRGTLNQNPDIQWFADDIALQFSYNIQSVENIEKSEEDAGFMKNILSTVEKEKNVNEEY